MTIPPTLEPNPGNEHSFVDSSLPTYDADAAALVTQRTLHFLSVL